MKHITKVISLISSIVLVVSCNQIEPKTQNENYDVNSKSQDSIINESLKESKTNQIKMTTSNDSIVIPDQIVDSQNYHLEFVAGNEMGSINEYIRSDETIDNWTRMLTVRDYNGAKDFKDVLPSYVKQISPYKIAPINLFKTENEKYKENVLLVAVLSNPKTKLTEIVVHLFVIDPVTSEVKSAVISERMDAFDEAAIRSALTRKNRYSQDLKLIDFKMYADVNK